MSMACFRAWSRLKIFWKKYSARSPKKPTRSCPRESGPRLDDSYIVDGATPIRELNREVGWSLPDAEATTIAGLVIHEAHVIPEVGQVFAFFGFKFEVLRKQRNQVSQLRIIPPPELAAPHGAEQARVP